MILKYYQVESKEGLASKEFEEGSLYLCTTTNQIFLDPVGAHSRVKLSGDPIILNDENEKNAIPNPIENVMYIVKSTNTIYMYQDNQWNCYGAPPTDDIFTTDMLILNGLGGISAGDDLNGLSVKQILTKLLYPYMKPYISAYASPNNGGTYEKGDNKVINNISVNATKKSEKITKIEILKSGSVIGTKSGTEVENGGSFNFPVNIPVNSVNVQVVARATDSTGKSSTSTTGYFTFVYPYYIGICNESDIINESLIKNLSKSIESKGTKNAIYNTNNQKMIIAYPSSYGVLNKILDPNSFDVTDTFSKLEISIKGLDGTTQQYYVYTNNPSTVSNFKMTFSY